MYFAVIFNKDLIPEKYDHYVPAGWPMYLTALKKDEWPPAGVARVSLDELNRIKEDLWEDYYKLQQDRKTYVLNDRLRIFDLVAFEFRDWHPSKIDFTKHLKTGLTLQKREVVMTKSGRPVKSVYYYEDTPIAEILFIFETDVLNFMTRRTERLGYYSADGDIHETWIIYDEIFDPTNTYHHRKRLEERTQARQWIIDSLRADIDKFLTIAAQQNANLIGPLATMINTFWVEYSPYLSAFINSGGTFLRTKFSEETKYSFLDSYVAVGVTARMYIIDKLTY